MIIVYNDVGGAHSTAVAANIHVGNLPNDRVPDKQEILNLPTFDKIEKGQQGHLIYIGDDEFGNKVYTIGCNYQDKLVLPALQDMYGIMNGSLDRLIITSTQEAVNTWMKIGGFSSRRLGLVAFGRPIVTYGTLKAYNQLCKIVELTKERIKVKNQLS